MSARGRGARRKRGGQLTGSRDGRGGGHAGALGFSARKPGRRWRRPERASERRREERRGGGRGAGTRGDRPRREKESERGRGRRRLIPLGTWSRRRAELGLERLQPPAKVKPPPARGFCGVAFHSRGPGAPGRDHWAGAVKLLRPRAAKGSSCSSTRRGACTRTLPSPGSE